MQIILLICHGFGDGNFGGGFDDGDFMMDDGDVYKCGFGDGV